MLSKQHVVSSGYAVAFRVIRTARRPSVRTVLRGKPSDSSPNDSDVLSFKSVRGTACGAASFRRAWSSASSFVSTVYNRIWAFFAAIYTIWTSWPGALLRWLAVTLVVSTVVANALVVPFLNARAVPIVEGQVAQITQRAVSMHGIRWISTPGIVGLGPLVCVGPVAVGPGPVENSEALAGSATVSVRPLTSLLRGRLVLDAEASGVYVTVRQSDNFSWFGYPEDTKPHSSRDFFPGLKGGSVWTGGDEGAQRGAGWGNNSTNTAPRNNNSNSVGVSAEARVDGRQLNEVHSEVPTEQIESAQTLRDIARALTVRGQQALEASRAARPDNTSSHSAGALDTQHTTSAQGVPTKLGNAPLASAAAATQDARGNNNNNSPPYGQAPHSPPEQERQEEGGRPLVEVRRITATCAAVDAFTPHDAFPRQFRNLHAELRLGSDYRWLELDAKAQAVARNPRSFRCTMPSVATARNLRSVTPGAEDAAPAPQYPRTVHGPSPSSRAKAELALQTRAAAMATGGLADVGAALRSQAMLEPSTPSSHPLPADSAPESHALPSDDAPTASSVVVEDDGPPALNIPAEALEATDEVLGLGGSEGLAQPQPSEKTPQACTYAQPAAAGARVASPAATLTAPLPPTQLFPPFFEGGDGGTVTVCVSASDIGREDTWPTCRISVGGTNLHAPLVERLFELPMDIYDGRLNGNLDIFLKTRDEWMRFPRFGGRVDVQNAAFHFWDSPDDFSGTNMDLKFEDTTCTIVSSHGRFGAAELSAHGTVGMNPETGEYDIQAKVEATDVNAVRATLGARPLPYPAAGAVSGQFSCYGALENPIFSGRIKSSREGAWEAPPEAASDAQKALEDSRKAGDEAHLAYDKVAFMDAEALFTFTASRAELRFPAAQARPCGGGRMNAAAAISVDPAAEHDPRALQAEFAGVGLDAGVAAAYAPALRNRGAIRSMVGPVSLRGNAKGSHAAPCIRASIEAPRCGSQAIVVLRREQAFASVRAPKLLGSATLLTEFPPFDVQKRAVTQAQASALATPLVTGARGVIDVRGADLQRLKEALDDPSDVPTSSSAATEDPAAPDTPLRVRGCLKLRVNETPLPATPPDVDIQAAKAALSRATSAQGLEPVSPAVGAGAGDAPVVATGGAQEFDATQFAARQSAGAYDGTFELQGVRFNQLQLAHALKGDFRLSDGRLQLDGDGFWAYEKLRANIDFTSLENLGELADMEKLLEASKAAGDGTTDSKVPEASAGFEKRQFGKLLGAGDSEKLKSYPLGTAALKESAGRAHMHAIPPEQGLEGGSTVELRHGNMVLRADVDARGEEVQLKADDLNLDKLHLSPVKGTLHGVALAANLKERSASGVLDIAHPHAQGMQAENLHVEAELSDGTLTLGNTRLRQAGSIYDIEGQYHLWPSIQTPPPHVATTNVNKLNTLPTAASMLAPPKPPLNTERNAALPALAEASTGAVSEPVQDDSRDSANLSLKSLKALESSSAPAPTAQPEPKVVQVGSTSMVAVKEEVTQETADVASTDAITDAVAAVKSQLELTPPAATVLASAASESAESTFVDVPLAAPAATVTGAGEHHSGISEPNEAAAGEGPVEIEAEVQPEDLYTETVEGTEEQQNTVDQAPTEGAEEPPFPGKRRANRLHRRQRGDNSEASMVPPSTPLQSDATLRDDAVSYSQQVTDVNPESRAEGTALEAGPAEHAVTQQDDEEERVNSSPDTAAQMQVRVVPQETDSIPLETSTDPPEATEVESSAQTPGSHPPEPVISSPVESATTQTLAAPDVAHDANTETQIEPRHTLQGVLDPAQEQPAVGASVTDSRSETVSSSSLQGAWGGNADATWWVKVSADAQLQDILPAAEILRRQSGRAQSAAVSTGAPGADARGDSTLQAPLDEIMGFQGVLGDDEEGLQRGGFAGEFAARADSIRAEFARMVDDELGSDSAAVRPPEPEEASLAKRIADRSWVIGDACMADPARGPGAAKGGSTGLPGVSAITGRVRGAVEARGGGAGATSVKLGLRGSEWLWGPVLLDEVVVDSSLDGQKGLVVEQFDVKSHDSATMSVRGTMAEDDLNATLDIAGFPLDTLEPLVRATLPSLQPPPASRAPLAPVAKTLSTLQHYARRAADALAIPYSPAVVQAAPAPTAAIRGLLNASGSLSGTLDNPSAQIAARVDRASLGAVALSTASATATVSPSGHLNVAAEVTPAAAAGSLALDAEASVPSGSFLNASLTVRDAGMAVLTELTGPSGPQWLEGRADVKLRAEGSMAQPSVSGSAALSRARLQVPNLKEPLVGVHGTFTVERDVVKLKDVRASAGPEGHVSAKGRLPLTLSAAHRDPRARLDMAAKALEMRHPAFHGFIDAQCAVTGSAAAPHLSGDLKVSRGSVIASGTFPQAAGDGQAPPPPKHSTMSAADQPDPSSALLHSLRSWRDASRASAATTNPPSSPARSRTNPPSTASTRDAAASAAAGGVGREDAQEWGSGGEGLTLDGFRILLGPDLRVAWFPFLQISLASPQVVLNGPAVPELLQVAGDVELGPGTVNLFATQFSMDRNHRSVISFPGEEAGQEPVVDVAMASREFRFSVAAPLRDAPRAITITRLADGATQAVGADAPELLEAQLRALLLEDDGQLAVQSLVANAVSSVLPRLEGSGRLGKAHWRLVGAPTPLLGNEAAGMFLGAQAEAEMTYGDNIKVLLSSAHLADAQLSFTYKLAPGVRAYAGYTAPRGSLTLMLDLGPKSAGWLRF